MKLKDIYEMAIEMGIDADPRDRDELEEDLEKAKENFQEMDDEEKEVFDEQRLENPYTDSRLLYGEEEKEIETVLVGINIDTGEVLLGDRLNEKEGKDDIDAVIGHHPRGVGAAGLHEVMHVQKDILVEWGIPVTIADSIMDKRIREVERKVRGANFNQSLDSAKLLDMPLMCVHTPADNLVNEFLEEKVEENELKKVGDIMDMLKDIPEYHNARKFGAGPTVLVGNENKRAGKVVVDMTGGTEGAEESYERMANAGVGTIIGMHLSEKHRKKVEKNHLNYVIAGHMASDSLGLNLFLDEIEKKGVDIVPCSGFIRHPRN